MIPKFPTIVRADRTVIAPDKGRHTLSFSHGTSKKANVITDTKRGTIVRNLDAKLSSRSVLYSPDAGCRDALIEGVRLLSGGSLVDADAGGVSGLTIQDCGADKPTNVFGFIYLGGRGARNQKILIRKCWAAGSVNEHDLRVHNTWDLVIVDCDLQNPHAASWADKKGASFNLRDGGLFRLMSNRGSGQFILGPLAEKDGGLYDPPGPERDRKLALRLEDVIVDTFELAGGYVQVNAGLRKLTLKNWTGRVEGGGGHFCSFKPAYGPRPIAREVTLENCHLRGGGKFISGKADKLTIKNCTWNGKKVA